MTANISLHRMRANHRWFLFGERLALIHARLGQWERAATYAQITASFASVYHPGLFMSPRLERVLAEIGKALAPDVDSELSPVSYVGEWPARVLHVFTEVHDIGGHSRWVCNWIGRDGGRIHSVALTGQHGQPIPQRLAAAVGSTGGRITELDGSKPLMQRLRDLQREASTYDLIVLSTNPEDVIPSIAFFRRSTNAPILRLNHADHRFWIGAGVTDVLADYRSIGAQYSMAHRGIDPGRSCVFPLPIDEPAPANRGDARRRLGISDAAVVIVTVGSQMKYHAARGIGFLDLVEPVLEEVPELVILAVGPPASGLWASAAARWPSRLRPLGPCPDLATFFAAANLYLESYPVGSDMATLEGALSGLPVVRYHPPTQFSILGGAPEYLGDALLTPSNPTDFRATLVELCRSPSNLERLGRLSRSRTLAVHGVDAWQRSLSELYALVRSSTPADAVSLTRPSAVPTNIGATLANLYNEPSWVRFLDDAAPHRHRLGWTARGLLRVWFPVRVKGITLR